MFHRIGSRYVVGICGGTNSTGVSMKGLICSLDERGNREEIILDHYFWSEGNWSKNNKNVEQESLQLGIKFQGTVAQLL